MNNEYPTVRLLFRALMLVSASMLAISLSVGGHLILTLVPVFMMMLLAYWVIVDAVSIEAGGYHLAA